jgi:hypothetical protein
MLSWKEDFFSFLLFFAEEKLSWKEDFFSFLLFFAEETV